MQSGLKSAFLAILLIFTLVLAGTQVANATPTPSQSPQDSVSKQVHEQLRGSGSTDCRSASVIKIQVDGREGDFTIGPDGKLRKGYGEVQYSGCSAVDDTSERSKTLAAAMQATFGSHYFSPNRSFYTAEDSNSKFWAQQSYDGGLTTAFRWAPSDYVKSIAYGPAVQAYAFKSPDNCSYNKAGESEDYIFHWSCTGQSTSKMYYLWGQWEFRAAGPGWSGYATITWDFDYGITYV